MPIAKALSDDLQHLEDAVSQSDELVVRTVCDRLDAVLQGLMSISPDERWSHAVSACHSMVDELSGAHNPWGAVNAQRCVLVDTLTQGAP